jgi:hypothetical protein
VSISLASIGFLTITLLFAFLALLVSVISRLSSKRNSTVLVTSLVTVGYHN